MHQLGLRQLVERPLVRDVGLACALAVSTAVLARSTTGSPKLRYFYSSTHADSFDTALAWWWVTGAILLATVLVRRLWPIPAYVLALAMAGLHAHADLLPPLPLDYAVLVCLFTVADQSRRLLSTLSVLYGVIVAVLIHSAAPASSPFPDWHNVALAGIVLLLVAWAAGDSTRTHRAYLAEGQARAQDAEREHVLQTELAIAAERERIARELHDIVAHGLSVMIVQTQGASAALDDDPDQAREALGSVLDTGRQAMADMRRLVQIARERVDGAPHLAPAPGVDQLPNLVAQIRASGVPVRLSTIGHAIPLDPATDLSIYRVVQEALTNVLKHAGPGATAHIEISFEQDTIGIEITDTGCPDRSTQPSSAASGYGLAGMRERVRLLGGRLDAGRHPDGGFRVHASLPAGRVTLSEEQ